MLARIFLVRSDLCRDPLQRLDYLCKAIRLSAPSRLRTALINQARELADSGKITLEGLLSSNSSYQETVIRKGLLLKPRISDKEPGVLFISFELEWARLLNIENLEAFSKEYRIVLAPSWSPPHSPLNYMFPKFFPQPIFNLISNKNDVKFFEQMSDNYHSIELYASNWVDSSLFSPRPKNERDIDILMVANFAKFKRHHVLFKTIKNMSPKLKVVLIGQSHDGRSKESILEEASFYGVQERVVVREGVYGDELMDIFCRAKVSLVFSKREGSCVVVTESFFADTPVGLLRGAEIGSKVFVNDNTGLILNEENLAGELSELIKAHDTFRPREWALENGISCLDSTNTLNRQLKAEAIKSGEEWTTDILTHHWRPDPVYLNAKDREAAAKEIQLIRQKFGVELILQKEKE